MSMLLSVRRLLTASALSARWGLPYWATNTTMPLEDGGENPVLDVLVVCPRSFV